MRKHFSIKHNGGVTDVGFRPLLVSCGILDYDLQVCPRNLNGGGGVDVIVEGNEEDINRFYEGVKEFIIKPKSVREGDYSVTAMEDYAGDVDFNLYRSGLTLNQMARFVDEAKELTKVTGEGFKELTDKMDSLPKNIAKELKAIIK